MSHTQIAVLVLNAIQLVVVYSLNHFRKEDTKELHTRINGVENTPDALKLEEILHRLDGEGQKHIRWSSYHNRFRNWYGYYGITMEAAQNLVNELLAKEHRACAKPKTKGKSK